MIFTEIYNCGEVGAVAIKTFHKYHNEKLHIYGMKEDFKHIEDHKNNLFIVYDADFSKGHQGTAEVFAHALCRSRGEAIHFDADVYFKGECLEDMKEAIVKPKTIAGTRRCYEKNPAGISVKPGTPDSVSTYFVGYNCPWVENYNFEQLKNMFLGSFNPSLYEIFDFGDAVTFTNYKHGGSVMFLDNTLYGGQNTDGTQKTQYLSNEIFNTGKSLIHFGGVGTGCSVYKGKSTPPKPYADWALGRYSLYSALFFSEDVDTSPTVVKDGKWVGGKYNKESLSMVKKDMK